ncbi:hypothetical protein D3C80_711620 [compost metagenome]
MTATASNRTEGLPANWPSAGKTDPSASFAPPILGATMKTAPPSPTTALRTAATIAPSEPSVTRIATLRPFRLSGYLPTILRAGEGSRSMGVAAGADALGRDRLMAPATRLARSSSTLRRLARTRARTWSRVTFDSSKTRALARWACSISVCERKKSRAWL